MPESIESAEPAQGSEHNTPSDTLPPRRRRRAASRPAGPPSAASEEAAETTAPAIPAAEFEDLAAAEPDEAVETGVIGEVAPAAEEAETSTAVEDAAPAGRTRRRATRRASAPAGAPKDAEAVEVVETVAPVAEPPPSPPKCPPPSRSLAARRSYTPSRDP